MPRAARFFSRTPFIPVLTFQNATIGVWLNKRQLKGLRKEA
jgi:hypothetical protein